ncbi:MAG: hypothetical protein KM310_10595 [Clostridiales bacterium]|nr:hypothetical protein [Clostridiales bacterium]
MKMKKMKLLYKKQTVVKDAYLVSTVAYDGHLSVSHTAETLVFAYDPARGADFGTVYYAEQHGLHPSTETLEAAHRAIVRMMEEWVEEKV